MSETVLYATGRQGDTADLGLDKTGLETDKRGRIKVDEYYRTAVPHIFAVGDCAGGAGLAATAMEQGRIAALHAFDQPVTRAAGPDPHRRLRDPRAGHGRPDRGGS